MKTLLVDLDDTLLDDAGGVDGWEAWRRFMGVSPVSPPRTRQAAWTSGRHEDPSRGSRRYAPRLLGRRGRMLDGGLPGGGVPGGHRHRAPGGIGPARPPLVLGRSRATPA